MRSVFHVEGFEGRTLAVEGGLWIGARLSVNGVRVPRETGGKYTLRDNKGQLVEFRLKHDLGSIVDGVPNVEVAGQVLRTLPPLPTTQYVWAALPLLLVLVGGAIGGCSGALAMALNARIFRRSWHPVLKYVLTTLVTLGGVIVWVAIGYMITKRVKL